MPRILGPWRVVAPVPTCLSKLSRLHSDISLIIMLTANWLVVTHTAINHLACTPAACERSTLNTKLSFRKDSTCVSHFALSLSRSQLVNKLIMSYWSRPLQMRFAILRVAAVASPDNRIILLLQMSADGAYTFISGLLYFKFGVKVILTTRRLIDTVWIELVNELRQYFCFSPTKRKLQSKKHNFLWNYLKK